MIRAKDWIVFLENGISLEELPIPKEHMGFVLQWLQEKAWVTANDNALQGYPPCIYYRKDIHKNIHSFEQGHKVKPILITLFE